MKKIVLVLFFLTFFIPLKVFATSSDINGTFQEAAKKYTISFPIQELGGCTNYNQCHTFCEDPLHHQTCINFAKSKKFYRGDIYRQNRAVALSTAEQTLGCDSASSCQSFCEIPKNQNICESFAKQYNLTTQVPNPSQNSILQKATETLGCISEASCKDFCSQESNKNKCDSFASQVGLRGGIIQQGPGGCTTEETCNRFCSDPNNFTVCSTFYLIHQVNQNTNESNVFKGPGGCNSESSCHQYCTNNPQDCTHIHTEVFPTLSSPQSANPTETKGTPTTFPANAMHTGDKTDPETYCKQTQGCIWTGRTCQCTQQQNYPSLSQQENLCKQTPNCSWTGTTCQCTKNITSASSTISTTPSSSNTTSSTSLIDCVGPDGKHFQTTQKQCTDFNAAWGKSSNQSAPGSSSHPTDYNSLSNGQVITCTGPDGGKFQATQQQCDYFNNAWKSNSSSSGGSSSGLGAGTSSSGSSTGGSSSNYGGCDTSCQQNYCSKCGGTWSNGTCTNVKSC